MSKIDFSHERQSAWMSKITNDGLTRSGTGCFSCTHMTTVGVKGLKPDKFLMRNLISELYTGCHLLHGISITQCYLSFDTSEHTPP